MGNLCSKKQIGIKIPNTHVFIKAYRSTIANLIKPENIKYEMSIFK